jgi:hypothetical protein
MFKKAFKKAKKTVSELKEKEAALEATTPVKGPAETRLEQQISSATRKPYLGKR